jgi:hypothetical protein
LGIFRLFQLENAFILYFLKPLQNDFVPRFGSGFGSKFGSKIGLWVGVILIIFP